MKVLITGKGGREHALAWKISQSPHVSQIYVAPGNMGCTLLNKVIHFNLSTLDQLLQFAIESEIDLTIIGSEDLLIEGIVDKFLAKGKKIFGPNQNAARLEGSKAYAKGFMKKYGVKTAKYHVFSEYYTASKYILDLEYPIVIKASGLAAGKGVIIAENEQQAQRALQDLLVKRIFGEAGNQIVIEEYLEGVEASMLCITDSKSILPLLTAKDHKKIGDGDTGPNTGGMGAIAPNPYVTEEVMQEFLNDILKPTLKGIQEEMMHFSGVIFFGLMITSKGVYLLEYNMRFGDPETQTILPLMESDLTELILSACDGKLSHQQIQWSSKKSCCIVASQNGYPEKVSTRFVIDGILDFNASDTYLFTAGVDKEAQNWITNGGRVLNVVATADTSDEARQNAYAAMEQINFTDKYIRTDIGVLR